MIKISYIYWIKKDLLKFTLFFLVSFFSNFLMSQALDVKANALIKDLGILYPESGMCPTTNRQILINVSSNKSINCVTTPVTVFVNVTGPVNQSFTTIVNTGSLSTTSRNIIVSTTSDFSKKGEYFFEMSATCAGDVSSSTTEATDKIVVSGNDITLTSALSSSSQTICLNSLLDTIKYDVSANATSATASGLPLGVTSSFNYPTLTISGSPTTNAGSPFSYSVTATGTCPAKEDSTLTGTITVKDLPVVKINDKSVNILTCNTISIPIVASGGSSYLWSDGTNTSNISINSPGKFTVTGFLNGCSNKDSITISEDKTPPVQPVSSDTSRCGSGSLNLKVSTTVGTTVTWYTSDQITPIKTGLTYTTPVLSSNETYYIQSKNTSTGCLSTKKPLNITVFSPPNQPITSDSSRCGTGSVVLKASTDVGNTITWYANDQTTILGTGLTYTTPSISSTTIYYAESKNTLSQCVSILKTPISAIINSFPSSPTAIDKSRCGTGTIELDVSLNGVNQDAKWYTSSSGGTSIFTGLTYTTGIINKDSTFYIESVDKTTKCSSVTRVPLKVIINSILSPPTATDVSRCGPGTVTLQAKTLPVKVIDWYTQSSGGSILSIGDTYVIPSVLASTSYFAEARDPSTGCLS